MKKKNNLLLNCIFILILSIPSTAQKPCNAEIYWYIIDLDFDFKIIGTDNNSVYVIKNKHSESKKVKVPTPYLVTYDKNSFEEKSSKPLIFSDIEKGEVSINKIFFLKDRFLMFVTFRQEEDKLNKRDKVYALVVSKDGSIAPKNKLIFDMAIVKVKNGAFESRNIFRFFLTADSNRCVAVFRGEYDNESYKATAFDVQLNDIWADEIKITNDKRKYHVANREIYIGIDNNTNLYMVLKVMEKDFLSKSFIYDYKTKKLSELEILPPNKETLGDYGRFFYDSNGKLFFTGLYGPGNYSFNGIVVIKYFQEKPEIVFIPFSEKMRAGFMSDSKAAKKTPVDYIVVDDMILNKDESFQLVFEKIYYLYSEGTQGDTYQTAIIKFDKNFQELWSTTIAKNQFYNPKANFIFSHEGKMIFNDNGNLSFLYNDYKKNIDILDPRESKNIYKLSDAQSVVVHIDGKDGSLKKEVLFSKADEGYHIFPAKCYQSELGEMFIFKEKNNNVKLDRLVLNNK